MCPQCVADRPGQRVWIGLTDTRRDSEEMLFRWTDAPASDVQYTNWADKQPSNQLLADRSEDCVSMRQVTTDYYSCIILYCTVQLYYSFTVQMRTVEYCTDNEYNYTSRKHWHTIRSVSERRGRVPMERRVLRRRRAARRLCVQSAIVLRAPDVHDADSGLPNASRFCALCTLQYLHSLHQ